MTDGSDAVSAEEGFEYSLRTFVEQLRAIATNEAESRPFSYLIAHEYIREIGQADPWLLDAPVSYIPPENKLAIRSFIALLTDVTQALRWTQFENVYSRIAFDWRPIPDVPEWHALSVQAARLLTLMHAEIGRNDAYFTSLG